jgi:hypothetical protein
MNVTGFKHNARLKDKAAASTYNLTAVVVVHNVHIFSTLWTAMLHFRQKITLIILSILGAISLAMVAVSLTALFIGLFWEPIGDITIFSNLIFGAFTFWAGVVSKIAFDKKTANLDSNSAGSSPINNTTPVRFDRTPEHV